MTEQLSVWIQSNLLQIQELSNTLFRIEDVGDFLLLSEKEGKVIDNDMNFLLSKDEIQEIESNEEIKYILFSFGGNYYYSEIARDLFNKDTIVKSKLNDFKYLGKALQDISTKFAHLGVHGEYELLNGSGLSTNWAKKAKFYGHWALGICDKGTLAGTLSHQIACDKEGIKPILGASYDVKYGVTVDGSPIFHEVTLYAINYQGWKNLLRINRYVNIDNEGFVLDKELTACGEGLSLVLGKDSVINQERDRKKLDHCLKRYLDSFHSVYYQLDSVDFFDGRKYTEYASGIKNYISSYSDRIKPILIGDSYYLDSEYCISQMYLNEIKKVRGALSHDLYYKNLDQHFSGFDSLYGCSDDFLSLLSEGVKNANRLAKAVEFKIDIGNHKLPAFEHDGDNDELFLDLLAKGFKRKILKDQVKKQRSKEYTKRLQEEASVIMEAGFVDYFLILWDIVNWTKTQGYLVGNARGSVAGSLVAYLLDITTVDPIQYDLLFERFLNKTRISGERAKSADSLPDVDLDFGGASRDLVKRYIEHKYGKNYVVSIGSFTRLKLKGAIKGFGRVDGMPFTQVNFITKKIENRLTYEWEDIFADSQKNGYLKSFVQGHVDMINYMKPILNQAQTPSIHASAVVIVPKKDKEGNDMTVFDWMPVRKIWDEQSKDFILISEWEGKYIERAGFLKEDILGIAQLDKFQFIISLIEKKRKQKIVLEAIPMDDPKVYKIFQGGFNEDVFQFGTSGLQRYSRQVKPDNIEDLIAMNALYRPGPMGSNAHNDFAEIKHGHKDPNFDYGLEEVTKNTHGLYVYQEQIMKAVHVLGGLTLSESDEVRTIMKKFDKVKMKTFRDKFIAGAKERGCKEKEANLIWDKLERFSGYGFNRSHAAAYSIMAYWCQWLKCHYPEEFYTTALNFSKSENYTINILDEIESRKTGLNVNLPDINKAGSRFVCFKGDIFWSLTQIKGIGPSIVRTIVEERQEGRFKDIKDFLFRMRGKGISRGASEILIQAGAFDKLYGLTRANERLDLMSEMLELTKDKKRWEEVYSDSTWKKSHYWTLEQKRLTGCGKIDFYSILKDQGNKEEASIYLDSEEFYKAKDWKVCCIAGRLMYIDIRNTKKGKAGQLTIESNNKIILVMIWSDVWKELERDVMQVLKKKSPLVAITGKVKMDTWHDRKILFSDAEITDVIEL